LSLAYARAGCHGVVLADMSKEGLAETKRLVKSEFPDVKTLAIEVDVTDEEAVNKMVDEAVQAFETLEYGADELPLLCEPDMLTMPKLRTLLA
jgi:NAD(P)-dependent dehydrogenase (short-subunit alcohol dehydrogenase family)